MQKKVEGHFPGASETTLAKLKLLGTDCDHEAMTGRKFSLVLCKVTLFPKKFFNPPRFRSFTERIVELGVKQFDRSFTTDGSHPFVL